MALIAAPRAKADVWVDCNTGGNLQQAIDSFPTLSNGNLGVLHVHGRCNGNFHVDNRRDFTIHGYQGGATLDGRGNGTVLDIRNCCGGSMAVDNLTITNGQQGIFTYGMQVSMDHLKITKNSGVHLGAGVETYGTAKISNSTIADNSAKSDGGGVFSHYGGAEITNTVLSGNHADLHGGAVAVTGNGATVTLNSSVIADNSSDHSTPGVLGDEVTLRHTSVIHNRSKADARGAVEAELKINASNSSITGNEAGTGSSVGGLDAQFVEIWNSTVANNVGGLAGGVYGAFVRASGATFSGNQATGSGGAGGIYATNAPPNLYATLLSRNQGTNPNCYAYSPVVSTGYNLISNDTGCNWTFKGPGDKVGTSALPIDARLGEVTFLNEVPDYDNPVVPLLAGSPANNAIPFSNCQSAVDQRGQKRPVGDGCDIGAFEYIPARAL